jgi:hypothetical protein
MLAVGLDKQLEEVAFRTNGEGTIAPAAGAVTDISAACAGLDSNTMVENKNNKA